jgi:hypothetical protein
MMTLQTKVPLPGRGTFCISGNRQGNSYFLGVLVGLDVEVEVKIAVGVREGGDVGVNVFVIIGVKVGDAGGSTVKILSDISLTEPTPVS